jgi:hypothetical protein
MHSSGVSRRGVTDSYLLCCLKIESRKRHGQRVLDAVQRPSRCSAESGPISTLRDGPRLSSAPLRAALRPGNAVAPPEVYQTCLMKEFGESNFLSCPGRGAACSAAVQSRDPQDRPRLSGARCKSIALHRIRGTRPTTPARRRSADRRAAGAGM